MRILKNTILSFGLAIFLSGCGLFTLPELGKVYNADADLKLLPKSKWNVTTNRDGHLWTKHGPLLDRLDIFAGVEDGEDLITVWGKGDNPNLFKKEMSALEIVELYKASLTFAGRINVETDEVMPANVAKQKGFEFTFTFRTSDGLMKKGLGRGTVRNEKLYLMVFTAPSIHYFDMVYQDAVTLMDTAHFPEKKEIAKK